MGKTSNPNKESMDQENDKKIKKKHTLGGKAWKEMPAGSKATYELILWRAPEGQNIIL